MFKQDKCIEREVTRQIREVYGSYSKGALCALQAVLWQSPTTDAGWDACRRPWSLVFMRHHRLHRVTPNTHGPLRDRDTERI